MNMFNAIDSSPLERIRELVFWNYDRLLGGKIKRQLSDIIELIQSPERREDICQLRLNRLIKHATQTTAYYERYKGSKKLEDFPIISKDKLKLSFKEFMSAKYKYSELIDATTTGSYGTPFTFKITPEKKARIIAEVIYFSGWGGYRVGMKYAQVRSLRHPLWQRMVQNETIINPNRINNAWLENNRAILKNKKIKFLFEYPNPLGILADYCRSKGDGPEDFPIIGACTSSESLTPHTRKSIEDTFGCLTLSRYSSQENGVIAHQHPSFGDHHLINLASHIVELLEFSSDKPVEKGCIGRVVVTDLFSYAMPLLRYDIGDMAVMSEDKDTIYRLPMFKSLEGRQVETIYSTSGDMISPFAIVVGLWGIEGIMQFQFVQQSQTEYLLRIVPFRNGYCDDLMIRKRLIKILGKDAMLEIEKTSSIEPLPSGKRPMVVNKTETKNTN